MSQYLPRYLPGDEVTLVAGTNGVVGSSPVTTSGLSAPDAAPDVAGVAGYDAAVGSPFTAYREGIHTGIASGAITNGDPLCTAAAVTPGVTPARLRRWVAGTDAVAARIGRAWSTAADGASVTYALINV